MRNLWRGWGGARTAHRGCGIPTTSHDFLCYVLPTLVGVPDSDLREQKEKAQTLLLLKQQAGFIPSFYSFILLIMLRCRNSLHRFQISSAYWTFKWFLTAYLPISLCLSYCAIYFLCTWPHHTSYIVFYLNQLSKWSYKSKIIINNSTSWSPVLFI